MCRPVCFILLRFILQIFNCFFYAKNAPAAFVRFNGNDGGRKVLPIAELVGQRNAFVVMTYLQFRAVGFETALHSLDFRSREITAVVRYHRIPRESAFDVDMVMEDLVFHGVRFAILLYRRVRLVDIAEPTVEKFFRPELRLRYFGVDMSEVDFGIVFLDIAEIDEQFVEELLHNVPGFAEIICEVGVFEPVKIAIDVKGEFGIEIFLEFAESGIAFRVPLPLIHQKFGVIVETETIRLG